MHEGKAGGRKGQPALFRANGSSDPVIRLVMGRRQLLPAVLLTIVQSCLLAKMTKQFNKIAVVPLNTCGIMVFCFFLPFFHGETPQNK